MEGQQVVIVIPGWVPTAVVACGLAVINGASSGVARVLTESWLARRSAKDGVQAK